MCVKQMAGPKMLRRGKRLELISLIHIGRAAKAIKTACFRFASVESLTAQAGLVILKSAD